MTSSKETVPSPIQIKCTEQTQLITNLTFQATCATVVVGKLKVTDIHSSYPHMRLFVEAEYRRQGIGTQLVQQVIQYFQQHSTLQELVFTCYNDNEMAMKFYKAMGMKAVPQVRRSDCTDWYCTLVKKS